MRFTVWHKTVHTFFRKILLISEWHMHIFDFESQEKNRTKILWKLCCTSLQTGLEGIKGVEGIFTYPPAFFLHSVFENSIQSFIKYSTVTFGFDPCALLPTGYRKRTKKEKKKEIWPSPMTKPPIPIENSKTKGQHTQTPPKTSISQRLRTDLGRSVGVTSNPTGVVKPVYGIPTFPLTAKAV